MRRLVVCGLLLLFGLFRGALATDYDLTIDPGSKSILNERSLTLYQQFDLVKPGDRIVSITVGKLPSPNIACRLWAGVGENSTVLVPKDTVRRFHGEIRLGKGDPGTNAVGAALLMHVVPPPIMPEKGTILQNSSSYIGAHPMVLILPAILLLIGVVVAFLRINAPAPGTAPLYGKRAYEENVREVKEKLERIIEAQEQLVRKPPVLRTFRKQIDRFDKRLEKLEVTAVSSQQALSVIASSVIDVQKHLDDLSTRHDEAQAAIGQLQARLAAQAEDGKKSIATVREDLRAQAAQLKESVAELTAQIGTQSQHADALAKSLSDEIRNQAAAAITSSNELNARINSQTESTKAFATSMAVEFGRVEERLTQNDTNIISLSEALTNQEQANVDRAEHIYQNFGGIMEQFQGLAPLPANVSELHGRVGNLKADITALSEKLAASTAELGTLQNTNSTSFRELQTTIEGLKGSLTEIGGELSKLQTEIDASRATGEANSAGLSELAQSVGSIMESAATTDQMVKLGERLDESRAVSEAVLGEVSKTVGSVLESSATREQVAKLHAELEASKAQEEKNGATLSEVAKSVDSVLKTSATKEQVAQLAQVPASIELLRNSLKGIDSRLAETGISKEDSRQIIKAHEKLGALSNEVSQAVQRALEQKLTALVAQSMTARKSKDSEGSAISDRGTSALAEVAQQLITEIEHQKNLDRTLTEVLAKIESIPVALEKLGEHIGSTPVQTEVTPIPVAEMMTLIAETKDAVKEVPARIDGIEKGLGDIAAKWEAANGKAEQSLPVSEMMTLMTETKDAVLGVPAQIEGIGKGLSQASAKWEEASDKLERAAQKVVEVADASLSAPAPVQAAKPQRAAQPQKPASQEPVEEALEESAGLKMSAEVKAVEEPTIPELTLETTTEEDLQVEAPSEEETEMDIVAPEEQVQEEEDEEPAKPNVIKRITAEEWQSATGSQQGTFATETPKDLVLVTDPEAAKRPLTPTETPGIEYQIGPMLCSQKKVIYAHGDSLRIFWPGGNERSILLSQTVPDDPWRLLLTDQRMFCVLEKRVEIIDPGNWTKFSSFAGEYRGQCAPGNIWAGIKGGPNPILEFRDMQGELVGKPIDLESQFNEILPLLTDGDAVWAASKAGKILKAEVGKSAFFCDLSSSKPSLFHFLLTQAGPVVILNGPSGLIINRYDAKGQVAKSMTSEVNQISGNVVAMGERLYFFNPERSELVACDLGKMELTKTIPLPNIQRVRRLVGFGSAQSEVLMVAGGDPGGKLGTVFLLDIQSERQVVLCSTNQPHVEALFGAGYAIVATSSSYQNIIRVFQPFENAAESGRAA